MTGPSERSWPARGATILIGRVGDALLRFGIFLATARLLSPTDFSLYALLTAALATSQVVFAFGAPRTAMFFHARGARRPLSVWLLLLAGGAGLVGVGGLAIVPGPARLLFPDVPARLITLGLAPLPFLLLCDSLSATLLSEKREGRYTAFLWSRTLGSAAVLGLCLASDDRLSFLLAGRIAVNAVAAVGLLLAQKEPPAWRGLSELAPHALRYGLSAGLGGAAVALHRRADVLLLSALGQTLEIGAYAVAYSMAEAVWMITDSLEAALFADLTGRDRAAAGEEAARALRFYRLGALFAFALGLAAGEGAAFLLFRDRYPAAAVLFPPVLAAAVIWGSSRPCTSYLYARGLGRFVVATHLTGLLLNVVVCLALIPRFGARGAAAASLASYAVEVVLLTRSFRRHSRTTQRLAAEAAP